MKAMLALATLVWIAGVASAQDADETAVKDISRKFVTAWNKGDAAGVAALYAPDAVLTTPDGKTARGRQGIQEAVAAHFREAPGAKMAFSADEVRPLGADAAAWRCEWKLTGLKDGGTARGTGLAVVAKTGAEWLIVEDLAALTPSGPPAPKKASGHRHGQGADHGHDHGPGGHSHDH